MDTREKGWLRSERGNKPNIFIAHIKSVTSRCWSWSCCCLTKSRHKKNLFSGSIDGQMFVGSNFSFFFVFFSSVNICGTWWVFYDVSNFHVRNFCFWHLWNFFFLRRILTTEKKCSLNSMSLDENKFFIISQSLVTQFIFISISNHESHLRGRPLVTWNESSSQTRKNLRNLLSLIFKLSAFMYWKL